MSVYKAIMLLQAGAKDPDQLSVLLREFSAVLDSTSAAVRELANGRVEWTGKLTADAWARLDVLRDAFEKAKTQSGTSVAITPTELMIVVDNEKNVG